MVISILLLLTCSEILMHGDAFGIQILEIQHSPTRTRAAVLVPLYTSSSDQEDLIENSETWSKAAADSRRSSPFKVRKRVRAVLEKARTRTGLRPYPATAATTSIAYDSRPVQSIVAEAASIGGLGDGSADIVVQITANGKDSSIKPPNTASNDGSATPEKKNGYCPPKLTDEELGLQQKDETYTNGSTQPVDTSTATTTTSNAASLEKAPATTTVPPTIPPRKPKDFDVIRGDVPAAAEFSEPLPFKLPKLTKEQRTLLAKGERLQEQSRMGREGSGYVILDVKAPPFVVWETLLDFESYPETIPTVKSMQLYTSEKLNTGFVNEKPVLPGTGRETRHYGTPSVTRAAFTLSKFRLNIAAIHRYTPHPLGDYMIFTLDRSCTNMVLKGAKGIWYTEENPDGREVRMNVEVTSVSERCLDCPDRFRSRAIILLSLLRLYPQGYTRVYLLCEVQISRALPKFIVDQKWKPQQQSG
jgi:hypothetical protein